MMAHSICGYLMRVSLIGYTYDTVPLKNWKDWKEKGGYERKGEKRRERNKEGKKGEIQERLTTDWVYSRNSYQLTFELRAMLLLVT